MTKFKPSFKIFLTLAFAGVLFGLYCAFGPKKAETKPTAQTTVDSSITTPVAVVTVPENTVATATVQAVEVKTVEATTVASKQTKTSETKTTKTEKPKTKKEPKKKKSEDRENLNVNFN
jgi:ribosomal protein L3